MGSDVSGLGYQLPAAFRAAPCQYLTAILRGHACTEPMCALTADVAGLIGALHGLRLQIQIVKGREVGAANDTRAQKRRFLRAHELGEALTPQKAPPGDFLPI